MSNIPFSHAMSVIPHPVSIAHYVRVAAARHTARPCTDVAKQSAKNATSETTKGLIFEF